jgi:hypothetical protein
LPFEVRKMPGSMPSWYRDDSFMHDLLVTAHDGHVLGYYAGRPIFERVYDEQGHCYGYIGVAPRLKSGRVDVRALQKNQWVVEPGLVYEWDRDEERR